MKHVWLAAFVCVLGGGAITGGHTQDTPSVGLGRTPGPAGPIILEDARPNSRPLGAVYTLLFLQVSGTKPTESLWLLEREDILTRGQVEPNATVFRSLADPTLRRFVSHLPAGTRIVHSPRMLTGPDPTLGVPDENEPGLREFITFCRSQKLDFVFGTAF